MIIGSFQTKTKDENSKNFQCTNCGGHSINIKVYSTFFNLGFPLFPTGKKVELSCNDCKKINPIQYKASDIQKIDSIKSDTNHPFYLFIFPAFFGILFFYSLVNKISRESNTRDTEINVVHTPKSEAELVLDKEMESYQQHYNDLLYASSILPEHPAAEYLLTYFQDNLHGNDKLVEAEADSFDNSVILVCYMPNMTHSTDKAKKELIEKTTKLLKNKFNYENFYLAFYGYDVNLYAIKCKDSVQTSQNYLSTDTEKLMYDFYREKEKGNPNN